MSKYVIDSETLEGLGEAIRSVTGSGKKYTPEEMIAEVKDILNATTFLLVDEAGNEYAAAYLDSDVVTTAGPNDIRKGYTAITAEGLIEGEKEIPSYYTMEGYCLITNGSEFNIQFFNDDYDFTKLQAIICPFSGSITGSVSADRVCVEGKVYAVNTTEALSTVTKDASNRRIKLGITNDSGNPYLLRFFTYREVY